MIAHLVSHELHEPDVTRGRAAAGRVHSCMNQLRAVAADGGAYISESNFFDADFQHAYWGANAARLGAIKRRYDPDGLFFGSHLIAAAKVKSTNLAPPLLDP